MGSWNEKYLGVECKESDLPLIAKIFDYLDIDTLEVELDARGIEVPSGNVVYDIGASKLFGAGNYDDLYTKAEDDLPLLTKLLDIISKSIGEVVFFYNRCIGNTISDAYTAWHVKMDSNKEMYEIEHIKTGEGYKTIK